MISSLYLKPRQAGVALGLGGVLAAAGVVWGPPELWWASLLLGFALVWASVVDVDRFILPDLITLGLLLVGVIQAAMAGQQDLLHRAIGAVVGYASLALIAMYYRRIRKREGLGLGDAKLLGAAGAWLGWAALPAVLLIASLSALAWFGVVALRAGRIDTSQPLPFGPFIAFGFWMAWMLPGLFGHAGLTDATGF